MLTFGPVSHRWPSFIRVSVLRLLICDELLEQPTMELASNFQRRASSELTKRNKDVSFWLTVPSATVNEAIDAKGRSFLTPTGSSPRCVVADDFLFSCLIYLYIQICDSLLFNGLPFFSPVEHSASDFGYFFYYQFHFRIFWRKKERGRAIPALVLFQRFMMQEHTSGREFLG
jgi:hypothetical protein